MAIGRITGQMLFPNLERQGVDLQVDTDLAYFDVNSRRLGIATQNPTQTLDVKGNAHIANLSILGNTITSDTGKIGLGSATNLVITGGTSYDVLYTDGNGNLSFGNLNSLATQDFFTGNNIALGTNTAGQLASNAITFLTTTSVTDAIAGINNLLGNISSPSGNTITTGNVIANYYVGDGSQLAGVSAPITISEYFYGAIANVVPHISTLRFDRSTGFNVVDLGSNTALISMSSAFKTWVVPGQSNIVAFGEDTIQFTSDSNFVLTTQPNADATHYKTLDFAISENFETTNVSATLGTFTTGNIDTLNVTTGNIVNLTVGNLTSDNVHSEFYGNIHTDYIFSQTGNLNIVPNNNGIVTINSTSSLVLPIGTTNERPPGTVGQIRFNSEYGTVEYYTGIEWALVSNTLEDQTIDYADGVIQTFTLVQPSTSSALLVSINGTMQQPGGANPAYIVVGDQITFAQAPLDSDIIDIRFIASTVTPDLTGFSGNVGTRILGTNSVNFGHGIIYSYNVCPTILDSHLISNVGTGDTILDRFLVNSYRTGKYIISSTNTSGQEYQTDEVIVIHNGTTAKITVYGTTHTGTTPIMNFSANIVSGNVIIYGNGVSSGNSVKLTKTLISI
jgi:hypothetical protein